MPSNGPATRPTSRIPLTATRSENDSRMLPVRRIGACASVALAISTTAAIPAITRFMNSPSHADNTYSHRSSEELRSIEWEFDNCFDAIKKKECGQSPRCSYPGRGRPIPTTRLRFFTVCGPWGRPDTALFLFTKAIVNNEPIDAFKQCADDARFYLCRGHRPGDRAAC